MVADQSLDIRLAAGLETGFDFLRHQAVYVEYIGLGGASDLPSIKGVVHGSWTLLRWQAETAGWVIAYTAIATFIILKVIGIFVPLRLSDEELEIGDHAIHGNEVYPSDVPTLGGPHAPAWQPGQAGTGAVAAGAGA